MEAEGSIFETSEMVANFLASTNLLLDSWRLCNKANSPASGPFLVQHNGPVGLVAFSGMHDLGLGSGSYMNDMVALQEGEIDRLFSGLGRHGDDHDEAPVMVHVGLLQLFLGIYGCPSFQAQMKSLLEKSKSIILTGHSIGGAIASLTALWLLSYIQAIPSDPSPPQILCITFGSPLLGNKSLSKSLLRQRWAGNFCHVVLKHDIIPRLLFAPLAPINTQLHCLLKFIQSSITSQSEQLPFHVTDEIKDQLFRFVLAYTEAVAKETTENMVIPAGLYWPFGNYLFYSEEGTVCVDNADAVVKLLYLMLAMGNSGSCCEDHLKYGGCVERMSFQFLMRRGFIHEDVPASSYDAGLKLAIESSGLASQESVSRQAKDSLKMVKQTGLTPSLNSARLAIALAKITPHRAQIEWYKASCDESENQMGYYDSFKRRASKRDYQVNLFRIKLASFWDNVINKIDNNELPHDFHKRRKWVNASHFYQLLVEPLDIAEYYRSGEHLKKGHYLRNGRERRHELFSKWWREKNNAVEEESKRSKLASLTQDSRFWAHVEEARELLEKVRQEKNSSNVAQLLQGIDEFEGYAKKLIDSKEVSSDVLAKNSSYSMWVEEVRELRLQMQQFPQLPSFVDAEWFLGSRHS